MDFPFLPRGFRGSNWGKFKPWSDAGRLFGQPPELSDAQKGFICSLFVCATIIIDLKGP